MSEPIDDSKNGNTEPEVTQQLESKPGFWQITMSVLAAALGVQTHKNHERDFASSSPLPYIVGGIIFTVAFILVLVTIVSLVLPD